MNDEWQAVEIKRRYQEKGSQVTKTGVAIPGYLLQWIGQEAKEKGQTRSAVIAYLIYCGLKAHTGEFIPPADNTIKKNYIARGRIW